jgi:hypothetical protein
MPPLESDERCDPRRGSNAAIEHRVRRRRLDMSGIDVRTEAEKRRSFDVMAQARAWRRGRGELAEDLE